MAPKTTDAARLIVLEESTGRLIDLVEQLLATQDRTVRNMAGVAIALGDTINELAARVAALEATRRVH